MVICSPPQPMWDITIHPSSGPSVLAGTISFLPSPTNVGHHNLPLFGAQRPRWHSFLPLIDVGPPPNPPPFGAQRPYWHTASCLPPFGEQREGWHIVRCLALISFVTTQIHG